MKKIKNLKNLKKFKEFKEIKNQFTLNKNAKTLCTKMLKSTL